MASPEGAHPLHSTQLPMLMPRQQSPPPWCRRAWRVFDATEPGPAPTMRRRLATRARLVRAFVPALAPFVLALLSGGLRCTDGPRLRTRTSEAPMQSVEAPRVLHERALPRDGQREEERVQNGPDWDPQTSRLVSRSRTCERPAPPNFCSMRTSRPRWRRDLRTKTGSRSGHFQRPGLSQARTCARGSSGNHHARRRRGPSS
jgi:hypothetical protein